MPSIRSDAQKAAFYLSEISEGRLYYQTMEPTKMVKMFKSYLPSVEPQTAQQIKEAIKLIKSSKNKANGISKLNCITQTFRSVFEI